MIPSRLAWLEELKKSLNRATGGQIKTIGISDGVDPLKKLIHLYLHEDWASTDFHSLLHLAQGFARANDCEVERIHKRQSELVIEVSTKRRLGPVMRKNPLT